MRHRQEKPEVNALEKQTKKSLGMPSSIALLCLKPGDNCFCASCGVKGRALRVEEVDFTP
jgi:hypothetical protein